MRAAHALRLAASIRRACLPLRPPCPLQCTPSCRRRPGYPSSRPRPMLGCALGPPLLRGPTRLLPGPDPAWRRPVRAPVRRAAAAAGALPRAVVHARAADAPHIGAVTCRQAGSWQLREWSSDEVQAVPGNALAEAGKSYMAWRWPPTMDAEAESVEAVAGARGAGKPHGPDCGANRSNARSLLPASRVRVAGEDGGRILGGALGDDLEVRRARLKAHIKAHIKARMHRPEHRLIWFDVDGLRSMQRRPGTRKAIAGEKGA